MKPDKQQIAGYGLHYHANNWLIPNTSDRMLFQYLIDVVRNQLSKSSDDQTIIISSARLGRMTGLDSYRTIPSCLERLEQSGLIKKHKNGITVMCDEYVTLVQYLESLNLEEKKAFGRDFNKLGTETLQKCRITVNEGCRIALLGMTGSSILLDPLQKCRISDSESAKPCKNVGFSISEVQNPTVLQGSDSNGPQKPYKNVGFSTSEPQNPTFLQGCTTDTISPEQEQNPTFLQGLADEIAKTLHFCRGSVTAEEFLGSLDPTFLQGWLIDFVKFAFLTGEVSESFKNELQKPYIFAGGTPTFLQGLASKTLHFCRAVIIYNNKNNNNEQNLEKEPFNKSLEEQKNSQDIQKGFEGFGKVEVIDFSQHEKTEKEVEAEFGLDELSQQTQKRADRSLKARNSYRNKPFIKVERVREIMDCLDEVVKSPVDFFLYQFIWGVYDLYCEHYHPSQKIDEEGEQTDEDSQMVDWSEMVGAALPQDEICQLAKNVYEDLTGAVQQGQYFYGDNNEWEVKFAFQSFEDFIPYEIFQWTPCTMQDKSVPAFRVALDKFYDIEASDVFTPSTTDKKTKAAQNKELIQLLMKLDDHSTLTPMEAAIYKFYEDFVVVGGDFVIDDFTDGRGNVIEGTGRLPDHILKPWCYNLPSVGHNELTSVLSAKYKAVDGIHKKAYIFSAEKVVEWNERNGYRDTVAHMALQPN